MKGFRLSDMKDFGCGTCSLDRMHGPITKAHHAFLQSVVPGHLDELISKELIDFPKERPPSNWLDDMPRSVPDDFSVAITYLKD